MGCVFRGVAEWIRESHEPPPGECQHNPHGDVEMVDKGRADVVKSQPAGVRERPEGRGKPSFLVCHRADGLPGQGLRRDPHSRNPVCGDRTSQG